MSDSEKPYLSKAELRRELKICQARYEQWLAAGIIPQPIRLTPESRAVHKRQDAETTRRRFNSHATDNSKDERETRSNSTDKRIKPVSDKHRAQYRASR